MFLCRRWGKQLPNNVQFLAAQLPVVAEPVIEVPKILPLDVPLRRLCRDTQLAEQLVEVPTIVSYSSLQRTVEQHVDIPVPGRGGRISGFQGFLPEQSSTAPQFSEERISERIVEQIVDIPRGGLQDFRPGQSSSSSSHVPAGISEVMDEPGEFILFFARSSSCSDALDAPGYWGFRTFPQNKKSATQPPHSRSELPPHSSPWTPSAYDVPMVLEEEEDEPDFAIEYVEPYSGWCLSSVHRQSGGYCRYATETGTHSVTLCFFGLVIDPDMAQRPFLSLQFC